MDFLRWLMEGIAKLWTQAINLLAPFFQRLFTALGLPIEAAAAQFLAALFILGFVAWLFRRVFWGKPKMFEVQKITLKTEKTPLAVVVGDMVHWVGWGILIGFGFFAAVYAVSGGLWFASP